MFLFSNKESRNLIFNKTFLIADIGINIILEIPFFSFNNTNINFSKMRKPIRRFYKAVKTLFIIFRIQLIDKHKFTGATLDKI